MKSGLYLIVETPRAGNLGHRTLVSPGMGHAEAISLVDKIRNTRIGTNYISTCRDVQQKSDSGGVRVGIETIGLVGIDVGRLTRRERETISTQLTECLKLVEPLVLHRMDWQAVGENDVVLECRELNDWLASHFKKGLPLWESKTKDRHKAPVKHQFAPDSRLERRDGKRTSYYIGALASLALFVILCALWKFMAGPSTTPPALNQPPSSENTNITTIESIEPETLKDLAASYNKNATGKNNENIEDSDIAAAVASAYGSYTSNPNTSHKVSQEQIVEDIHEGFGPSEGSKEPDGRLSAWMLLNGTTPEELKRFLGSSEDRVSPEDARFYQDRLAELHDSIIKLGRKLKSEDYQVKKSDPTENAGEIEFNVQGFNDLLDFAESASGKKTSDEKKRDPSPYFYSFDEAIVNSLKKVAKSIFSIDQNTFAPIQSSEDWPAILRAFHNEKEVLPRLHEFRKKCESSTSSISNIETFLDELSTSVGKIVNRSDNAQ